MSLNITFPFVRDVIYPITAIGAFQQALVQADSRDPNVSAKIRGRKFRWAKFWDEELLPVLFFASQKQLPEDATFRIMPEGHPVDVEVHAFGETTRFQITLAYPDWDLPGEQSRNPGYIASQERDGMNQGTTVFLGGQSTKTAVGQILFEPRVLSHEIGRAACEAGLRKALADKFRKAARYNGNATVLLICFRDLRFHTDFVETRSVVTPVIREEIGKIGQSPFRRIVIVDYDPLAYVEYS